MRLSQVQAPSQANRPRRDENYVENQSDFLGDPVVPLRCQEAAIGAHSVE